MAPPLPNRLAHWISAVAVFVVVLGGFLLAAAPVTTNDLFWHVATGARLWQAGGFPEHDAFSYTATERAWFLHEWLTQLAFFGMHEFGGMLLLRVFTGAMAVAILLLVHLFARRLLANQNSAAIVLLVFAILAADRFQTRPTLFSMIAFCGTVAWLALHRGPWRWRDATVVVLTTLVWTNLHSVGLLAPIVYATFVAGALLRESIAGRPLRSPLLRHGATLVAAFGATLATPEGLALYGFAFQDKGIAMNFIVDEWGAFRLDYGSNPALSPAGYALILATLGTTLAVFLATGVALNRESNRLRSAALPDPVHALLLLLCLGGGLMAVRFHWMIALALAFAIAQAHRLLAHRQTRRPVARSTSRSPLVPLAGGFVALTLLIAHVVHDFEHEGRPLHEHVVTADYYQTPTARSLDLPGIRFLQEAGLRGNAFCHYGSGGMLTYALFPEVKVFIDSRADLYGRELLLEFLAIRDGRPDQQRLLDRHGTDLYYRHWEIAPLREPRHWTRIYSGPDGEIFLRKHDRNLANLARAKAWHRAAAPRPATAPR